MAKSRSALVVGALALGTLCAAPVASAADGKASDRDRVEKTNSAALTGTVTFDENDQPSLTGVDGHSKVLGKQGKVVADSPFKPTGDAGPLDKKNYACVYNRKRKGFVAYQPQELKDSRDAYYIRFLYHVYKQNNARTLVKGSTGKRYKTKQVEVCFVGGATPNGGNHLSRVYGGVTMRGPNDRLIGQKWGKGKELSNVSASLGFAVPIKAVTIEGSLDVHPSNDFLGSQGPDKDDPASWAGTEHNQVNTLWEGNGTIRTQGSSHFEGNVGHALYETPQSLKLQPIEYGVNLRYHCSHPFGVGCA